MHLLQINSKQDEARLGSVMVGDNSLILVIERESQQKLVGITLSKDDVKQLYDFLGEKLERMS